MRWAFSEGCEHPVFCIIAPFHMHRSRDGQRAVGLCPRPHRRGRSLSLSQAGTIGGSESVSLPSEAEAACSSHQQYPAWGVLRAYAGGTHLCSLIVFFFFFVEKQHLVFHYFRFFVSFAVGSGVRLCSNLTASMFFLDALAPVQ